MRDVAGRIYIDCLAGAGALALGHHHPVVVAALRRTIDAHVPLSTLDLATPVKDAFIERLMDTLPPPLANGRIQFCGPSGADAVEAAVKLVGYATGRSGMVAFRGAYHGMTQGALELSGDVAPKSMGWTAGRVQHLPFPATFRPPVGEGGVDSERRCAEVLEGLLQDDHGGVPLPAGVIMEPVQGEGGVLPAGAMFARAVREATARAEVPLILDEVQTGLGRTGTLWAFERAGVVPDVLVLSKAIGGGLPLAVIVYREGLDRWPPGAHAGTFRGNQLAMAAGEATIAHVVSEGLAERAEQAGRRLMEGLRTVGHHHPEVGEVRGRGLMVGVEIVDPRQTDRAGVPVGDGGRAGQIQSALLAEGVLAERGGRAGAVVRLLPPLVIGDGEIDEVVAAFGRALQYTVGGG